MSSISQFTEQDYKIIHEQFDTLMQSARRRCADENELDIVKKAFDFANKAHKDIRRRSGEPYMLHPIEVAKIVVNDIGLGYKSIAAALLHDVVEDSDYTGGDIRKLFGDKIATLVEGLTKIKTVLDNKEQNSHSNSIQAENFKRILLTLNDDVRVVLIKLADRLHNCRTIEFMPEYKRDKILSETMFIFVPLAHRLGLYEIKSQMEDIWLKYKEPFSYKEIYNKINEKLNNKNKEIDLFISPIEESLKKAGFNFEIKKRIKSPYSIWHKMINKNISFEQVYDLYAVRIIFNPNNDKGENERDQCYHIFSIITGIYKYKADRIRDWVKHPKNNGYEALHCTLMSQTGIWIEVQIRSRRMDDIAEKGISAHWAYKKDGYISESDSEMDKWLTNVKEILMNPEVSAFELLDIIHNKLTTSEIMVFTQKGEQKSIQKGATALDFAYLIHSQIGNKAIAAKVNMKLVPLSYSLRTGDQIEIITAQSENPKKEWLGFLKTKHAKNVVLDYFKKLNKLEGEEDLSGNKSQKEVFTTITNSNNSELRKYRTYPCCNPIPGDPVVGFKNEDGSISIHKKSCHVAENYASKHGELMITPGWEDCSQVNSFPISLSIKGLDRLGILQEISHLLSLEMQLNIIRLNLGSKDGIFEGEIELYVHDKADLENMIQKMKTIKGIQTVIRIEA